MRGRLVEFTCILGTAAALLARPALADAPCAKDAERLCPRLPAGQLWACLQRSQFQLSSECQQNLQEIQRRASQFSADCAGDVYRFCPDVPVGQGRVLECLGAYAGRRELSTNCEDAVLTALTNLQEFAEGCADDAARLCPGVQSGGGRVFLCLRAKSSQLSSRCKQAVNP
jgi:hypothetical protein